VARRAVPVDARSLTEAGGLLGHPDLGHPPELLEVGAEILLQLLELVLGRIPRQIACERTRSRAPVSGGVRGGAGRGRFPAPVGSTPSRGPCRQFLAPGDVSLSLTGQYGDKPPGIAQISPDMARIAACGDHKVLARDGRTRFLPGAADAAPGRPMASYTRHLPGKEHYRRRLTDVHLGDGHVPLVATEASSGGLRGEGRIPV